jgi:hypothetical protein
MFKASFGSLDGREGEGFGGRGRENENLMYMILKVL